MARKIVKISPFPSFNHAKNKGKQESNESEGLFSKKVEGEPQNSFKKRQNSPKAQRQKKDNTEQCERSSLADSDGAYCDSDTSSLSDLSEDNDVPEMTSDAILAKWLADGEKALEKRLRSLGQLAVQATKPLRGPYKKQGTTQSVRTQQNNKKKAKDAYNKARSDGYEDIAGMFSKVSACMGHNDMAGEAENGGVVSNGSDSASVKEIGLSVDAGDEAYSSDIEADEHGNIAAEVIEDEEGLGPLLDIFSSSFRSEQLVSTHHWLPANPRGLFRSPPTNEAVDKCIQRIEAITNPKRATGYGHKDPKLNRVVHARLETMASFLRLYNSNGYCDWARSAELAATAAGKGPWLARRVKEWTHNLIDDPEDLPIHSYGKFNSSILVDEDIENEICLHLQEIGPFFCAMDIVHFLKTPEMTRRLTLKKMICERTAQRWLKHMSYRWKREPKGQYKDGHERSDVVAYRQGGFLPAVGVLEPRMTNWGINGEALPDDIPDGKRVVFWSHDESTFYANDRRKIRWVHSDESAKPYAKGEGASLMAADYVSPDFGWLRSPDGSHSARVLFKAGKTRDGYFTNTEIIDQASNAMDILDEYFPRFQHVFGYDNATNHKKRRGNALSASKMTVNPSPVGKPNFLCTVKGPDDTELKVQMDDGRFADGTPQSLYFPESHPTLPGRFKGMRQILRERFEHGDNVPNPDRASPKINGQCKDFKCEEGQTDCCLRRILYNQQDFAAQKSALEEVCEARGYTVLFFPKFHCELNSLEQSWGFAKRIYREFPSSSKEADLERNVITALEAVPLVSQRR